MGNFPKLGLDSYLVDVLSEENNGGACAISVQSLDVILDEAKSRQDPIGINCVIENGSNVRFGAQTKPNGLIGRLLKRNLETTRDSGANWCFYALADPVDSGVKGIEAQFGVVDNIIGIRLVKATFLPLVRLITRAQNTIAQCPALWISPNVRNCLKSEIESIIAIDNDASNIVHAQVLPSQINPAGLELVAAKDLVDELLRAFDPEVDVRMRTQGLSDLVRHFDIPGVLKSQLGISPLLDYSDEVKVRSWFDVVAGNSRPVGIGKVVTARENRPAMLTEQRFDVVRDGNGGFILREMIHQPHAEMGADRLALEVHCQQLLGNITAVSPDGIYDVQDWDLTAITSYLKTIVERPAADIFPKRKTFSSRYDGEYHTPGDVVLGVGAHFLGDLSCNNLTLNSRARFEGNARVRGNVIMGEDVRVVGNIVAKGDITIGSGEIEGNLHAQGNIFAESIGHTGGSITAGKTVKITASRVGAIKAHNCELVRTSVKGDVDVNGRLALTGKYDLSYSDARDVIVGSVKAGSSATAEVAEAAGRIYRKAYRVTGSVYSPEILGQESIECKYIAQMPLVGRDLS